MIELYSGTPGSGKSYHAALRIIKRFERGGGLICNFPVTVPKAVHPKKCLRVSYWDNSEITPQRLTSYAEKYHEIGVEGQTLLVVDECQIIWNSRDTLKESRKDWIKFFSQHRKLGYNILMIAQTDRMIDRQIRALIETETKHRKLNNYGFGGMVLTFFTGRSTWFIGIDYWYGGNKLKLSQEVFRYKKKNARIYDSYHMFDDEEGKNSLYALNQGKAADLRLKVIGGKSEGKTSKKSVFELCFSFMVKLISLARTKKRVKNKDLMKERERLLAVLRAIELQADELSSM